MLRSCGTQPMPAPARSSTGSAWISRPASVIVPACRRVTPTRVSSSVVLPVPLRPSKASERPGCSVKLTSVSTTESA